MRKYLKTVLTGVLAAAMVITSVPAGFAAYGDDGPMPVTYEDSDTYETNKPGFMKAMEDLLFTKGGWNTVESAGKIGWKASSYETGTVGYLRNSITDSVTWTVKDDILIFTGKGGTALPILYSSSGTDGGLFSKNPYIKTVIIGPGITDIKLDVSKSTSIETIIYINNVDYSMAGGGYNKNINRIYGTNTNEDVTIYNKEKGYIDCKDKDEAISEIKKILANTTLNDAAKAMIPSECGGTGANPPEPKPEPEPEKPKTTLKVDDWAKSDVESIWNLGIAFNTRDTDLTQPVTRRQFAKNAVEIYQIVTKTNPDTTKNNKFTDIEPWDVDINRAYNLGIISGISETNFDPNGTLTREQAATMLARLATACGKALPSTSINPFSDTISTWAKPSVMSCKASGIMNGVSDTEFNAKATYSIQQALVTMLRLYNYVK